jgi:PAS domain S-box-containing protein
MNVSQPLVQASLVGEAIDHGPALVFVADEDMRYVAVNQHACDVLGYTRPELLALTVPEVAPAPDTRERFAALVAGPATEGTSPLRRKDGTDLSFTWRATHTTVAGLTLYVSVGFVDAQSPAS